MILQKTKVQIKISKQKNNRLFNKNKQLNFFISKINYNFALISILYLLQIYSNENSQLFNGIQYQAVCAADSYHGLSE
jgi:hypothetical protein